MNTSTTTGFRTGTGGQLDPTGINHRKPAPSPRRKLALALASLVRHDFPLAEAASLLGITPVVPIHPRGYTKSGAPSRPRTPLGAVVIPPESLPADSDPARHAGGVL